MSRTKIRQIKAEDIRIEDGLNYPSGLSHTPNQIDRLFEELAGVLEKTAVEYDIATSGMVTAAQLPHADLVELFKHISIVRAHLKFSFLRASHVFEREKATDPTPVPSPEPEQAVPTTRASAPKKRRREKEAGL